MAKLSSHRALRDRFALADFIMEFVKIEQRFNKK
jgi:hypothetical protein